MQFKVPQNVQREDTIIAFLTLKHLIILGIGGGLDYAVYLSLAKSYYMEVWLVPVAFIAVLTVAVAFWKPHNISFLEFIFLWIETLINPQKRFWVQGGGTVYISKFANVQQKKVKADEKTVNKDQQDQKTMKKLNELSKVLDSYGGLTETEAEKAKHDKLMELINKK